MYYGISNKIIFRDEAHFHLDGVVNRQNCRIWGAENSRVIVKKQMHPQRGADFGLESL